MRPPDHCGGCGKPYYQVDTDLWCCDLCWGGIDTMRPPECLCCQVKLVRVDDALDWQERQWCCPVCEQRYTNDDLKIIAAEHQLLAYRALAAQMKKERKDEPTA